MTRSMTLDTIRIQNRYKKVYKHNHNEISIMKTTYTKYDYNVVFPFHLKNTSIRVPSTFLFCFCFVTILQFSTGHSFK